MNRTMINFSPKKKNSIASEHAQVHLSKEKPTDSLEAESVPLLAQESNAANPKRGLSPPKLKQKAAFRHTEYAKGFYKVGTSPKV